MTADNKIQIFQCTRRQAWSCLRFLCDRHRVAMQAQPKFGFDLGQYDLPSCWLSHLVPHVKSSVFQRRLAAPSSLHEQLDSLLDSDMPEEERALWSGYAWSSALLCHAPAPPLLAQRLHGIDTKGL